LGKAIEISVWKPHPGKWTESIKRIKEFRSICLKAGVKSFEILAGAAGKDVGNIVIIQTFKGLADNGAINESLGSNPDMQAFNKKYASDVIAELVSHDLYEVM